MERRQRAAEEEAVLSEKEQLRIHLERMEQGNAHGPEAAGDGTGSRDSVAEQRGSEEEV